MSKPARKTYSLEQIHEGLTELALAGGNASHASKRLAERGVEIPRGTLTNWAQNTHVDQYEKIRDENAARIQRKIAARHEDLAIKNTTVLGAYLDRAMEELPNIPARDLPGAVRNLATTGAISVDKVMVARERPLQVVEKRNHDEIVRQLIAMKVATWEGEGSPVPDAEVVNPTELPEQTEKENR